MRKFFKHWKLGARIWSQLNFHIQMNHWKAANTMCRRIERMKVNRWYIRNTYPFI